MKPATPKTEPPTSTQLRKAVLGGSLQIWLAISGLFLAPFSQADPLDFWTWRNPVPTGNSLNRIVHANGQFVAVARVGTIITSSDGTNWVQHYSATSDSLSDIAWGDGTFVAVGGSSSGFNCTITASDSSIVTSPDGSNWTKRASPTTNVLSGVAFGNSLFVAIGGRYSSCWDSGNGYTGTSNTTLVVSSDGSTWTEYSFTTNNFVPTEITYGRGLFVVVGTAWSGSSFSRPEAALFTSPDGINWTQRDVGTNHLDGFSAVAYGNGQFVATGNRYDSIPDQGRYDGTIYTSTNGINWAQGHVVVGDRFADVVYDNGRFTVVGHGYYYIWYFPLWRGWLSVLSSTDGTNWSYYKGPEMPTAYGPEIVAHGNGLFIGATWNQLFSSLDTTNWTEQSYQETAGGQSVTFGGDQFVAVGGGYDYAANRYFGSVLTSPRGMSWTERGTTANSSSLSGVAYGGGQYVAVGNTGTILSSSNAFNWVSRRSNANDSLQAIAYGNGSFVAVGRQYDSAGRGIILSSRDATTWTQQLQRTGETDDSLSGVAFGNGQFVAVGCHYDSSTYQSTDILLTSPDGISWTPRHSGLPGELEAVACANGMFVAVGGYNNLDYGGFILTSLDGVNWTETYRGGSAFCRSISYGGGSFFVSQTSSGPPSATSTILTSSNGLNWTIRNAGTFDGLSSIAYGASNFVAVGGNTILQAGNLNILNPNPTIFIQPANRYVMPAESAQFTVSADGIPPLHYHWRFNAQDITNGTNATLALNSVTVTNEGSYSVVVWNGYGSVTSAVARLYAHLPPPSPQPPPPAATLTTQPPPAALTAAPRKPSSAQMVVFSGGGLVDASKMTIVLTHGWKASSSDWPTVMANSLIAQGFGANANIVAWDWHDNANTRLPSTAAARSPSEGEALGSEVLSLFGASYNKPIHFIGHSLGTMVNCRAADFVHGDAKNSPGKAPGSTLKFNPLNTHMTLFDEAELVTAVNAVHFMLGSSFNANTAGNLSQNFWSKVVPDHSAWIDNYLSEVGLPHSEAANVLLWRNAAFGIDDSHGYAYQWYAVSIANPTGGPMGHRWSFERNSLGTPPARGTCFLQNVNSDPWTLQLTQLSSVGEIAVAYPSVQAYRGLNALGSSVLGLYLDGIEYAGDFVANTAEMFAPLTGQPVFVGTANSTPAYYAQQPASQTYQAGWDLQFTVQAPTAPQMPLRKRDGASPADADGETNSPVYAWVPVSVPREAVGMSFEFRLEGAGTNEYFTMGISNENYLTMEAKFVEDGVWTPTTVIEIPEYAGQQVSLFFGLNGDGSAPIGKLSVRGIQFYSPPPPALSIGMQGTNAVLSWPISAIGWQLETVSTVILSNQWGLVTNVPAVLQYQSTVTNPISGGGARFFRLKK